MEKDLIVVCSEPVAGREGDYNDFCDGTHALEAAGSKGVVSAQISSGSPWRVRRIPTRPPNGTMTGAPRSNRSGWQLIL
jgi:hypothetical protein